MAIQEPSLLSLLPNPLRPPNPHGTSCSCDRIWHHDATLNCRFRKTRFLERVTAAAEERQLLHNSLTAYRHTELKPIAWAGAEGLVLEIFIYSALG